MAAALLAATFAVSGCKGSSTTPANPEGGVADTAPFDSAGSCANDDGTRNKTKGQSCSCNQQCATGFCADGYCCDTACEGTCMSCGLRTSLGTCTVTPAGLKPRTLTQCAAQDVTTCGLDGTCDGTGKCRKYESGSVCKAGACDGDAVTNTFVCDGSGACKLGAATVCAPFSCNSATKQCFGTCSSDADCVSGRKCVNGSCGKKMNGALCPMGDAECASGHCADGVCCNTGCGGACRSCNLLGLQGTCSPVSAGKGHPLCAQTAPETCGTTGVCDGFGTCSLYPPTSPCGGSTCLTGNAAMNTARTCDGLGACQPSEVQACGSYRCANNACNSKCTVNADCADGIACVNGSCGPKLDGQKCAANSECQNQHCVDGVCCNTACTGACRSCNLTGNVGKCTMAANGASDPRATCKDMGATTCGTDGKCDGTGTCRKYAAGTTVCAPEMCVSDVYTGPSTCNSAGQCIKPNATACFPYHCNATKCFSACTTSADCITPNICGMNGVISSCGLKPNGAACNVGTECASTFCAQGFCCNSACNTACKSCSLAGTVGSCSNVASGVDPQGMCAVQAAATCGTTGSCAAGACARWASGTQCVGASCPTTSTRAPASTCNGTGTCVTPPTMSCAPGRCTAAACVNTCVTSADCTAPATCVNGSCGLQPKGGSCTATSMCAVGLTCYLSEGSNGVCCDTACSGTCESCKLAGTVGTCTAIPAGTPDPDPASLCVAAAATTCGLNGRCAGNNIATNAAGTARCQFFPATQACAGSSCTPGNSTLAATETAPRFCTGAGTCAAPVTKACAGNKCDPMNQQCATSCMTSGDCVTPVTCNSKTGQCGDKLAPGALCGLATDCASGFCSPDGVCCNTACTGACQQCNAMGSAGTCTNVPALCNDGNACNGTETCNAAGACVAGTPAPACTALDTCHAVGTCNPATGLCSNPNAPNGTGCSDGNSCTQSDTCQSGTCTAGAAVTCPIPDQCHAVGTCNPANGTCSNPAKANGTGCDDGSACTQADSCQGGVCTGANPVVCSPLNQCHDVGACNPVNGICSNPAKADGVACNDSNSCTQTDTCQGGMCMGSNPVVCPAPDECHGAPVCTPADGTCSNPPLPDTTPCSLGMCCGGVCAAATCT